MKKESQSNKALYSRFILWMIFTLLVSGGIYAQCSDSDPGAAAHTNINFDPANYPSYIPAIDYTDLKSSGIHQVYSVTINGAADADITSMTITNISIRTPLPACGPFDGPYDANSFPAGYGITFQNSGEGAKEVKIFVTNPPPGSGINYGALPVGSHITFVVNAVRNTSPSPVSRKYTFEIVGGSFILGDTHITTVDGVKYDFQAVGEFVALRADGGDSLEIQARQTAVATSGRGTDSYSGLSTCVSVNTAVAARVGKRRVTYQPRIDGIPDSTGMELRVDGKLTELGDKGIDLGSGGRIMKSPAGGGAIQIDFPDGASLAVTPAFWSPYKQWYLNISINNTGARMGISGAIAYNNDTAGGISRRSKSWLPALPDGSSVGPMPQNLHQRFITLYQTFADAWRVTDQTTLFDYDSAKSTASYTDKNWPAEYAQSCSVAGQNPKAPIDLATAQQLAAGITDPILKANAIYDVMLTGEPTFAQTYLRTQQIQTSTTAIRVTSSKDTTKKGEAVTFTANVARKFSISKEPLTGSVEFTVDGKAFEQVKLDASGNATLTTASLETGQHQIAAKFTPTSGSTAFASSSLDVTHIVIGDTGAGSVLHQWWFWLIVLLIIIAIFAAVRRKKKNP